MAEWVLLDDGNLHVVLEYFVNFDDVGVVQVLEYLNLVEEIGLLLDFLLGKDFGRPP